MSGKHGPGFHHIAIRAKDYDGVLKFYNQIFGYEKVVEWGDPHARASMIAVGDGNYIEVFEGRPDEEIPEGAILHYALRVESVDKTYAAAIAQGAISMVEPKDVEIPGQTPIPVRLAFIKGLAGEVIELYYNDIL